MIFQILSKKSLGIDIGTSVIKIVEMSRLRERKKLDRYGQILARTLYEKPFRTYEKNTLLLSSQDISRAIKAILQEARIKTKKAVLTIPDFSSFFTNFELPPMAKEELDQAVRYEARLHVPLPLKEVALDWRIIKGRASANKKIPLKILLVAVPNEIINQYKKIAMAAGLELLFLEPEVFALRRSLVKEEEKGVISLIDIGAQSTTCSIIEKGTLRTSHSFDLSGNDLTQRIVKALGADYQEAEELKTKKGILIQDNGTREVLLPLIDLILSECEKIFKHFYQTQGKEIQKIILAGGCAFLPGLKDYFADFFQKEVEIAKPFDNIFCPPILEKTLKQLGPSYAIAVGAALRGIE